jgi:2-succinyl-6-hydroxy-2,4-cyclohexadiene-1-carboxylate synthase
MPWFESFYFETSGDSKNPAIVLLHGFMGNSGSWDDIIAQLNDKYFCVTLDLPGHGRTLAIFDSHYSFEKCAEIIVGLSNELKLNQFNLVGYSMGGRLALYLAMNFPKKISKLVLESSSPGLRMDKERKERRQSDESLAVELETKPLREFVDKWYGQPLFESLKEDKIKFESLLNKRLKNDTLGLAKSLKFMGTGVPESLWEKLSKLTVPTLLIVGELDRKFQDIAGQMSHMSQKIKIESVTDAGHNVHFEKPRQYAGLLSDFFKRNG